MQRRKHTGLFHKLSTHPLWTLEILQEMLSEYDWKSTNIPKIFVNFDWNSRKPFKFLQNSGIPQDFESVGSGILQKLQLSFLEILKFLGTGFGVVHSGGVDIFWNSPFSSVFSSTTDRISEDK